MQVANSCVLLGIESYVSSVYSNGHSLGLTRKGHNVRNGRMRGHTTASTTGATYDLRRRYRFWIYSSYGRLLVVKYFDKTRVQASFGLGV